jgi:hypothetical protein
MTDTDWHQLPTITDHTDQTQIDDYNAAIDTYSERIDRYNEDVRAYNARHALPTSHSEDGEKQ